MNTRMVITGKEAVYLGKTLGTVYLEKVELRGCPTRWVDSANKKWLDRVELTAYLEVLADQEARRHPFKANEKMGRKMFWRNALGYMKRKYPPIKPKVA